LAVFASRQTSNRSELIKVVNPAADQLEMPQVKQNAEVAK
jgi:hypothetical protein